MTVIYSFPNAQLSQVVLQGEDMYVLDSANQQVYRITLTTDGMGAVPGLVHADPGDAAQRQGDQL